MTAQIPTARTAHDMIDFQSLLVSSSIRVPTMKHTTPIAPVMSDRLPEKNPWDMAHVMKLTPI